MTFCCSGFAFLYERAGSRGFGLIVNRRSNGEVSYILQSRAVARGEETLISAPPSVAMSLVSQLGMTFCPWCGNTLDTWYGAQDIGKTNREMLI